MVCCEVPMDMDVQGWHVVPRDGVQKTHERCIDEVKSPLGKGE